MVFTELRFLFFFAVVFTVYWMLPNHRAKKQFALLTSWLFYGLWDWRFLSLIWISTVVDFIIGKKLDSEDDKTHRKRLLWISLGTNLGILAFFKYANFFIASAVDFFQLLGLPVSTVTLQIVLPVGISFYTFQTLSYSIDIYRRRLTATQNPIDFALFVSFFPQLVAGPIVRAKDFLPQLQQRTLWKDVDVRGAMMLFLLGFIKKAVVADNLAPIVDSYFAAPESWDALSAWGAVLFYATQIYCDFSGYSDMAIAIAALLGYRLCQNFDAPYLAADVTAFWRKWHMSLSFWLRDYLYISLGGNRLGERRRKFNLMATMVLGGLWHGAAWTFVIWGFLHGLALIVHKAWHNWRKDRFHTPYIIALAINMWWVCLAWIFFRAQSLSDALITAKAWVFWTDHGTKSLGLSWVPIMTILGCAHLGAQRIGQQRYWREMPWLFYWSLWGVIFALSLAFMPVEFTPFLYFQF